MAVPGDELVHQDAVVFPALASACLVLHHPFLGEVEIPGAVSLSDADHGVVRPVCHRMADASPEVHRDPKAAGAGKLAVREQRLVDAAPERRASDARFASAGLRVSPEAVHWMRPVFAAAELYKQGADQSAA